MVQSRSISGLSNAVRHAVQVLLATLRKTEYTAAQSATVWAINALVQGQKSMLPQLLRADTIETFLHCICADNGAAPGTVRLLLVVFLHSGKHEELRGHLLESDAALAALLRMLGKGPAVEPTKWTASLLSTLCWQENSMKAKMLELDAPAVRRCAPRAPLPPPTNKHIQQHMNRRSPCLFARQVYIVCTVYTVRLCRRLAADRHRERVAASRRWRACSRCPWTISIEGHRRQTACAQSSRRPSRASKP
jgi:hypothetical protein